MAALLSGSGCKKKEKVNNQPGVAVVAMVTAAVVAWWQTAVQHRRGSLQRKMEVAAKSNQPEVAAAVVHGSSAKWKWLKTRKKRLTINQRWQWWQRWQWRQWHGSSCHATSSWQHKMDVAEKQKLKG